MNCLAIIKIIGLRLLVLRHTVNNQMIPLAQRHEHDLRGVRGVRGEAQEGQGIQEARQVALTARTDPQGRQEGQGVSLLYCHRIYRICRLARLKLVSCTAL